MTVFLIVLTVAMISCRSIMMKIVSDKENSLPQMLFIFGTAAVVSLVIGLFAGLPLHTSTLICALAFGVCNFLSQFLNLKAMSLGTASNVVFIISCNFLVSSLYGIFVFREQPTVFRILGIALVCVAQAFFCFGKADAPGKKVRGAWLVYALLSMFFSGVVGIIQKYMGRSAHPTELVSLSLVAAATSALIASGLLTAKKQWSSMRFIVGNKKTLFFSILLGIVAASLNVISTKANALVDSSLVQPIFNCSSLLLSIITARLLFKDHLTKLQKISLAVGIAAICIIGL